MAICHHFKVPSLTPCSLIDALQHSGRTAKNGTLSECQDKFFKELTEYSNNMAKMYHVWYNAKTHQLTSEVPRMSKQVNAVLVTKVGFLISCFMKYEYDSFSFGRERLMNFSNNRHPSVCHSRNPELVTVDLARRRY